MKLSAMEMIVLVAGVPLISTLMNINQWYPLGLSSILLVVAGLIALTLPETHPQHRRAMLESPNPVQGQAFISSQNEEAQPAESYIGKIRKLMPRADATAGDFLKNPGIVLCLGIFLLAAWGAHVWALLLQYISQRFGWEFSTVGTLFLSMGPPLHWVISSGADIKMEDARKLTCETGKPIIFPARLYHASTIPGRCGSN